MTQTKESETATDVVPWEEGELPAMIEPTAELIAQAYRALDTGQLPPEVGDPAVTARLIRERIRRGTLADALAPASNLPSWGKDYANEPVVVHAFHLNPSQIEESPIGVYGVVELGIPETGELVTVTCGGGNVLEVLIKAWAEQAFPFRCKLVPVRTSGGFTTYRLQAA